MFITDFFEPIKVMTNNPDNNVFIQKMKTNVFGLDKLLFGGLNLVPDNSVIIVKCEDVGHGTLLGIQLLFGLSQSLKRKGVDITSLFISNHDDLNYLNSILLDTVISSVVLKMTNTYVSSPKGEDRKRKPFGFTNSFFIMGKNESDSVNKEIDIKSDDIDIKICEEGIYYSNRTHSLHERTLLSVQEGLADSDEQNLLYHRKHLSYSELRDTATLSEELDFPLISLDFFSIPEKNIKSINAIADAGNNDEALSLPIDRRFIALDLAGGSLDTLEIGKIIDSYKKKCKVLICVLPSSCSFPNEKVDMVIELKNQQPESNNLSDYLMSYLRICQSKRQVTSLGWHLYKYRDYGIEVFPSLHTYFQKRRYLQRAVVNTHSSILSDTYQQYLDKALKQKSSPDIINYDNYIRTRKERESQVSDALFPNYAVGYSSVNVLEYILIPRKTSHHLLDFQGSVTAIIGDSNNYKRFITFGSIFSSSLDKEHTLIILLNKDADTIRRRLSCPARSKRGKDCEDCHNCYQYIHFMDICMGNITADEFIYYLVLQFETVFDDGNNIKRVVIDDLQIVDFCFPLLKSTPLFLSALVSICRERGIQLYILCDKNADKVTELRAVADNIICTGRDKRGSLQIYIERYIGFNYTPSKIYCGTVKRAKELFECFTKVDENGTRKRYFKLNSVQIDDDNVSTMKDYWD